MRICLAMAFQNEAPLLKLHLPVIIRSYGFHGMVGLDGGSQDGSADEFMKHGGVVVNRPFDWNFSAHINFLIDTCEHLGYDALIRLDPDELMWPCALSELGRKLWTSHYRLFYLPRYNFWRSRKMYSPYPFPDWQARAFVLNAGVRLIGNVHEQIAPALYGWAFDETGQGKILMAADSFIYHYGEVRSRPLQHLNYGRISRGEPPLAELPPDVDPQYTNAWRFSVPFGGPQPLDPGVIGEWAPW